MPHITIVGAGAVGSYGAEFLAARLAALEIPSKFTLIDHDTIDHRNFANQFFTPSDKDKPKAEVMAERVRMYGHVADSVVDKITPDNLLTLIPEGTQVVLDMVDNIKARELTWLYSLRKDIPCLHVAVSKAGHGKLVWSVKDHDHFNIGIKAKLQGNSSLDMAAVEDVKDPPCKLVEFSSLCIQAGMAAGKAVTIWAGKDPEAYFGGEVNPEPGTMVAFRVVRDGHMLDNTRPIAVHGYIEAPQEDPEAQPEETVEATEKANGQ